MLHIFKGQIEVHGGKTYLTNELFGIDVMYNGTHSGSAP